ncbi:pentapeptide repeat-containing protein [Rhodococcus opacus]|uniref:pentapeptide repeat-containing protein n=1 Tax=Rhodococcus opacus TaxID=37919 RepID=UPI00294A98D8|nr:pentapeptide repeat-containing protein [Rhodococcus opacus]MDV6245284.1 pentapeptide repeat-containing protein [Rhodococcus opacus]
MLRFLIGSEGFQPLAQEQPELPVPVEVQLPAPVESIESVQVQLPEPVEAVGWTLTQPWATVLASLGILGAAILAFVATWLGRRQTEKHFTLSTRRDRFTTIAAQLADPSAAVRIAGVYALEALADDWLTHSWYRLPHKRRIGRHEAQTCIDVLCSYLREPYEPSQEKRTPIKTIIREELSNRVVEEHHERRPDDSQVRQSILRVIASHLQSTARTSWSRLDFDFTGAYLENTNFRGCLFRGMTSFNRAQFHGEQTWFAAAEFHGESTRFDRTQFYGEQTWFAGTEFHSKTVSFTEARFYSAATWFNDAEFHSDTSFNEAQFFGQATGFSRVRFHGGSTEFSEAQFHSETTRFDEAQFHGEVAAFNEAGFHSETTSFEATQFQSETTSFHWANFYGKTLTSFENAQFHGAETAFVWAHFHSEYTSFRKAQFLSDITSFQLAEFESEDTAFHEAQFHSSVVDFSGPTAWRCVRVDWEWPLPSGWEGPAQAPQPVGVIPEDWPPEVLVIKDVSVIE